MSKKKWFIVGIISSLFLFFPMQSFAESNEKNGTDVGIQFEGEQGTSGTTSSEKKTEPSVPENPISKPTGRLPMTGELMQPIILLLLGWLAVALITVFLFGKKKEREEQEESQ
ncbi:hypothetical protein IGJ55_002752 [Enterococcus sp. AZ170]|uniref:LPXTG cell wall anchor domain-containing protein n=1 Tax=unclassified Enterococcus TaxID=2608891 RepID=UPI003D2E5595